MALSRSTRTTAGKAGFVAQAFVAGMLLISPVPSSALEHDEDQIVVAAEMTSIRGTGSVQVLLHVPSESAIDHNRSRFSLLDGTFSFAGVFRSCTDAGRVGWCTVVNGIRHRDFGPLSDRLWGADRLQAGSYLVQFVGDGEGVLELFLEDLAGIRSAEALDPHSGGWKTLPVECVTAFTCGFQRGWSWLSDADASFVQVAAYARRDSTSSGTVGLIGVSSCLYPHSWTDTPPPPYGDGYRFGCYVADDGPSHLGASVSTITRWINTPNTLAHLYMVRDSFADATEPIYAGVSIHRHTVGSDYFGGILVWTPRVDSS